MGDPPSPSTDFRSRTSWRLAPSVADLEAIDGVSESCIDSHFPSPQCQQTQHRQGSPVSQDLLVTSERAMAFAPAGFTYSMDAFVDAREAGTASGKPKIKVHGPLASKYTPMPWQRLSYRGSHCVETFRFCSGSTRALDQASRRPLDPLIRASCRGLPHNGSIPRDHSALSIQFHANCLSLTSPYRAAAPHNSRRGHSTA